MPWKNPRYRGLLPWGGGLLNAGLMPVAGEFLIVIGKVFLERSGA
jgi:hypothetical protein